MGTEPKASSNGPAVAGQPLGVGDEVGLRSDMVLVVMGLYSVVVGLALANSLSRLAGNASIQSDLLVALFLLGVVPFYHGALASTMLTYVNRGFQFESRSLFLSGRPMYDMMMLFTESLLFYAMSVFTGHPGPFLLTLLWLFIVDLLWAMNVLKNAVFGDRTGSLYEALTWRATLNELGATLRPNDAREARSPATPSDHLGAGVRRQTAFWVWLDVLMIVPLAPLVLFEWRTLTSTGSVLTLILIALGALMVVRTTLDYWRGYDFYFPRRVLEERPVW